MKPRFFLFKFFLGIPLLGLSQNYFEGFIYDSKTKEPLPFVHFIYEGNKGFISNQKGAFLFYSTRDTLEINAQAIGYESKKYQLRKGKIEKFYLNPKSHLLNEVVVTSFDPEKELIQKVIENIPKNYPLSPEKIFGITREETFWDSLFKKPIYKAEIFSEADKFSYAQKNRFGNVKIIDKKIELHADSTEIRFYAGAHNVHRSDYVMRKQGVLDASRIKNYILKIKDTLFFEDRKVIKMNFESKSGAGTLFIDLDSFAVMQYEIEVFPEFVEDNLSFLKLYKRTHFKRRTDYSLSEDGKWRLKFVHYETSFKHRNKPKKIYLKNTFSVQKFEHMTQKIPVQERFAYEKILTDYILSDTIIKNKNVKSQLNNKWLQVMTKIRSELGVSGLSIVQNPYQFSSGDFEIYRKNKAKELRPILISNTSFLISNPWSAFTEIKSSFKKRAYIDINLGISYQDEISLRGIWRFRLKSSLGNRKIRDQVDEILLSNPISLNAKHFDSGRVTLYSERRETYWGAGFNLIYKIKEHLSLGIDWTYYLPLFSKQGLFVVEEDEFWFWNRTQLFQENSQDQTKWFQNNFSLGLSFYFSL